MLQVGTYLLRVSHAKGLGVPSLPQARFRVYRGKHKMNTYTKATVFFTDNAWW